MVQSSRLAPSVLETVVLPVQSSRSHLAGRWETHTEQVRPLAALDHSRTCLCERHTWLSRPWFVSARTSRSPDGSTFKLVKVRPPAEKHPLSWCDFGAQESEETETSSFCPPFCFQPLKLGASRAAPEPPLRTPPVSIIKAPMHELVRSQIRRGQLQAASGLLD